MAATSFTRSARRGIASVVIRVAGPETLREATTWPVRFRTGAATQRTPSSCSPLSTAYPDPPHPRELLGEPPGIGDRLRGVAPEAQ